MWNKSACYVLSLAFLLPGAASSQVPARGEPVPEENSLARMTARVEASPTLPFHGEHFAVRAAHAGWESGLVSWVAAGRDGLIYEIQRGDEADPVLVVTKDGNLVRSWGNGNYKIPHSIRLDPSGNVWTVDASSSTIIKYSRRGQKLLTITVAEQPPVGPDHISDNGDKFNGTTDIAFAPNGHVFITDGYGNARVLEYTAAGKRLKQWGRPGNGPGEFQVPHAIQIGLDGTIYVADRENGRIEKFDLDGSYLGEISGLGRVFSLKLVGDVIWAAVKPLDQSRAAPGWVVKLDRESGKILGHLDVPESMGLHTIDVSASGEPIVTLGNQLLWFRHDESAP
jgi:hypothetical protein